MGKAHKLYSNIHIRNTVYTEIGIGVIANALLLLVHVSLHITRHRPKPTDLAIGLLALIHLSMLLIKGFIDSDIYTSQGERWGHVKCKLLIYLYRLMRGFSLCTTCLLSVLQAITLSPRGSCLAKFKHKSSHHSLYFLLFLWVIYSSFSSHLFISINATPNLTSDNFMNDGHRKWIHVALLCRHNRQSYNLHSTSLSPISSPELRATWTILLLLSCFVVMSILDSILSYARLTVNGDPIFYCIQILVAHSYASFSPLVFIATEKLIISILRYMWGKTLHISIASDG
ncbi:vomeronasal type-1 receptor 94-like [Marmota monax]|uniref:vomeronasal type-1 receptor 94-like n=1 Tax=Marmota monax TaxID=9995 RepID=UPI001EAFB4D8|nr:vomeronasal type-1 receptor 94-like [Marmota monax]